MHCLSKYRGKRWFGVLTLAALACAISFSCLNPFEPALENVVCGANDECPSGFTCDQSDRICRPSGAPTMDIDGGIDGGADAAQDASVQAPDATPGDDDIPCGPLICGESCCITGGGTTHACDVAVCGGTQYECDGQEDCQAGEDCCTNGTNTFCAAEGSCPQEVCHNTSTCTDGDDEDCERRGGNPFPTCFDD